jgi:hypothetical protein
MSRERLIQSGGPNIPIVPLYTAKVPGERIFTIPAGRGMICSRIKDRKTAKGIKPGTTQRDPRFTTKKVSNPIKQAVSISASDHGSTVPKARGQTTRRPRNI